MKFLKKVGVSALSLATAFSTALAIPTRPVSACLLYTSSKEEIDLNRAKEAKKRAEERIKHSSESTDLQRAEIALKKAITRINVKNS